MELKQFIKTVLIDICEAVKEAKQSVDSAAIAPATVNDDYVDNGQMVSFEILVRVNDTKKGDGSGKIEVLGMGVGVGGEMSKQEEHSSKIQFQVPVYYSARFTDKEK